MEISYTKQQQKQKQKQSNKNQDSDTMEVFNRENQLLLSQKIDNYFEYTLTPNRDLIKITLDLPISVPILKLVYSVEGKRKYINVYPTVQFLYSNYIMAPYITREVKQVVTSWDNNTSFCARFHAAALSIHEEDQKSDSKMQAESPLDVEILDRYIRQNPQFTLAALREGIYVIGMKNQFNIHDLPNNPLHQDIQYISDEMGFILYDNPDRAAVKSVDAFGPYFIEQYILLESLSKQEIAQNVLEYYVQRKEQLQQHLDTYDETKGQGFICWRFIMTQTASTLAQKELEASDQKQDRLQRKRKASDWTSKL